MDGKNKNSANARVLLQSLENSVCVHVGQRNGTVAAMLLVLAQMQTQESLLAYDDKINAFGES